MTDITANAKGY